MFPRRRNADMEPIEGGTARCAMPSQKGSSTLPEDAYGTGTQPGLRIRDAELRRVKATCCLPATVRDGDRQDEEHDIED